MRTRRILSLFLAIALLAGILTGCGTTPATPTATTSASGAVSASASVTASASATPQANPFAEKLTISMNLLDDKKDDRVKWLESKFNVEFDISVMTWDDMTEKTRLFINSGDMPDQLFWALGGSSYSEFVKYAREGMFKELPAFGDNYPNLQAYSDVLVSDDAFAVEGRKYVWPSSRGTSEINHVYLGGFLYRKDWADKLGMAKSEYTWDEMLALCRAFRDKDPGGLGAGQTIPMGMTSWGTMFALSSQFVDALGYYRRDGKVVWGAAQPETLEYVKMFQKMYQEGIIWQDQLISGDAGAKFTAGQMGVYYDGFNPNQMGNWRKKYLEANPNGKAEDIQMMILKNPSGQVRGFATEDYWGCSLFPATLDQAKFDRILAIMDWECGEEGMDVLTKGIPGVDWEQKGNAFVSKREAGWNPNADGVYNQRLFGVTLLPPVYYTLTESPNIDDTIKRDCMAFVDRMKQSDAYIIPLDYQLDFTTTPALEKNGNFRTESEDKIKDLVVSSKDIETDWNEYVKSMEPKVQPVLDELNAALSK